MRERLLSHRRALVAIAVVPFVSASLSFTCNWYPRRYDPGPTTTPVATATDSPTDTPQPTATSTPAATPTPLALGFIGVRPWAVLSSTQAAAGNGAPVSLTYPASFSGDILAIGTDGSGSSPYSSAVANGSSSVLCAAATQNCSSASCPGPYPDTCAETSPGCDGPECTPVTGNLVGSTRTGIDFMMNNTSAACDTFDEAFTLEGDGTYTLDNVCDPAGGGACESAAALCSRRVLVLPLVNSFGTGTDPVTISGFSTFWLDGYTIGQCQGNTCAVQGRFVNASYAGP